MSGLLLIEMLVLPRRRICAPEPAIPSPRLTLTPGALAASRLSMLSGGSTKSRTAMDEMLLPTSRRRACPAVPVTTTSSSESALSSSWTSSVSVSPDVTVIGCRSVL